VLAYFILLRRKKKAALRYASLSLVRDAMGAGQRLRRHVPPILYLIALTLMLIAVAAPGGRRDAPDAARDGDPVDGRLGQHARDRREAEPDRRRAGGRARVRRRAAEDTRIGVVSFAATASVVQSPTHSREDIVAAIDRFQLQRGTAVGSGILVALKMIFPDAEFDLRSFNPRRDATKAAPLDPGRAADKTAPKVPPGSYESAAIILLTDWPDDRWAPTRSNRRASPPIAAFACTRLESARPMARRSAPKDGRCAFVSTRKR
jgi:Ca-activated chloride channel family protein